MRKDEILALRERTLQDLAAGLEKKRVPVPQPDSRLYPQDVDGELFWIDRLGYPDRWPHTGYGDAPAPVPGLRYEVWYFQKRETCLLALLCETHPALASLTGALEPLSAAFVEEGRYARRYRPVTDRSTEGDLILRIASRSRGIWRTAPLASDEKRVKALETLITDTHPAVTKILEATDPDGQLPNQFRAAVSDRDPLAELQARFNREKRR